MRESARGTHKHTRTHRHTHIHTHTVCAALCQGGDRAQEGQYSHCQGQKIFFPALFPLSFSGSDLAHFMILRKKAHFLFFYFFPLDRSTWKILSTTRSWASIVCQGSLQSGLFYFCTGSLLLLYWVSLNDVLELFYLRTRSLLLAY